MTKKEYAEQVAELIEGAKVTEVVKNGITLTGVNVPVNGSKNFYACYYIDNDFEVMTDVERVARHAEEVVARSNTNFLPSIIDKITDYEQAKDMLSLRMYNKASAFGYQIYKSAEEYGFDDLILVPEINIVDDDDDERRSVIVTDTIFKNWGITKEELFEKCIDNIKDDVEIKNIQEVLIEMLGGDTEDLKLGKPEEQMYVVSNKWKVYGAPAVLFAKERLQEIFPNGYVILPSSVHEVLAVAYPEEAVNFSEMVQSVNENEVSPEEILGNKAYIFK